MAAKPVEWVLVIFYGPSAHRATYGRLRDTKYTKDYIQLSRKRAFIDAVTRLFPVTVGEDGSVPLIYKWPTGTTPGELVFNSADRPHLKWETSLGAPKAWKMSLTPGDAVAETIPGNPAHTDFEAAESELAGLARRGAGQPYLMAIKLQDEPTTLHLRAYLRGPSAEYAWANLADLPLPIQELANKTTQPSALAWETFASGGSVPTVNIKNSLGDLDSSRDRTALMDSFDASLGRELAAYLRRPGYGIFFDPTQNHNAWICPEPLSENIATSLDILLQQLDSRYPAISEGDAAAEAAEFDGGDVITFERQIEARNYSVADSFATTRTRGSAQRAFANAVKRNYGYRCAITGMESTDFLVASHIVPWSQDESIRLDPSNGICLSLIMDRAFERGHLRIEDDLTLQIDQARVGNDAVLWDYLQRFHGQQLSGPADASPKAEYLRRRRALFTSEG